MRISARHISKASLVIAILITLSTDMTFNDQGDLSTSAYLTALAFLAWGLTPHLVLYCASLAARMNYIILAFAALNLGMIDNLYSYTQILPSEAQGDGAVLFLPLYKIIPALVLSAALVGLDRYLGRRHAA